ncbi:sine oculis-binding protein homolog B [Eucyclogobius newberryi]|uniref:sine oculis-binding protein homolog B n=1 Tax=Eucyclogobius newberryi TaxID=166745 RepID=UPI003B5A52B4
MPEMEKGRPSENKRSRKPAHPVKRELNQEMKTFAESTMNELLGWYGYDKVELRESEANEIRNYRERRQHVSVLKENSLPKSKESKVCVSSVLSMKPAEVSSVPASSPSSSTSSTLSIPKELKSAPVIVPLIKPSAVEDTQAVQIVCVWCQKEGVKRYSLSMGSELKSFCSEKCFAACRRAYFKRNKARDEDLQSERSPQPSHTEDSPRLVLKINSSVRSLSPVSQACDWCKHVRYTKEYLDFGSGEERLQFCTTKCLNQYKMDVFYREARAALSTSTNSESSPGRGSASQEGHSSEGKNSIPQKLLTPESWTSSNGETRHRKSSPKINVASESPPEPKASGSRTLDRPPLPQPPVHPPAIAVSPHHNPAPHPLHHPSRHMLDHHPHVPLMPMPFIRPPLHAQGLKSPLTNPSRHPGPPSSPIHRPPHSPHFQHPNPAATMNPPGLMHPFPGAYFPGLHSPPLNMLPRGPVPPVAPMPMPHMMNFGIPSFSPLLPHPTILVPYPIIVPLPIPIPIPIPIPLKTNQERSSSHSGVIQPVPEGLDRSRFRATRPQSPEENSSPVGDTFTDCQDSPSPNDNTKDWVKSERSFPSPSSTPNSEVSSHCSENFDYKQSTERHVIQRVLHRTQVKVEPSANGVVDLSGLVEVGVRPGNIIRSVSRSPPPDTVYHLKNLPCSPKHTSQMYEITQLKSSESATNGVAASPTRSISPSHISPEEVKENKCQNVEPQTEEPVVNIGDVREDPHVPDEDHAYALPTTPKSSGTITPTPTPPTTTTTTTTTTPLLLPKLRDKGNLRTPATAPPAGGDMEPAMKRRCLRLREQNK